ncbi:universal stress protein family domain protein [Aspergillus homomorphus CBS 101889]|uniref:UspA domain-containing protein n=1 Tax=Aspergillus homomorphus (strain CBS 101889) TaxID=1450537 RepID=A0A395HTA9_ASPHC|nr:hypothetical protein BO97DRAFT_406887 [Aspergillus homomorphus CBS 101889]RAL10643.1 hypothetical protein BO97DRAFT_406887 [Aspergillus homomorphus CBS 101889]
MPYYSRKPAAMSLETALEEERRELLRESGEGNHHHASSWYPRRSLLDIAPSPGFVPPRHGSIAGIGVGVTSPSGRLYHHHHNSYPTSSTSTTTTSAPRRSSTPTTSTAPSPTTSSRPPPLPSPPVSPSTSPTSSTTVTTTTTTTTTTSPPPPRTTSSVAPPLPPTPRKSSVQSDGGDKPGDNPATTTTTTHKSGPSIRWDSALDMPPSARRASQSQEKPPAASSSNRLPSMAAVMSGLDIKVGFPSFVRGRDSGRSSSSRGNSLDSRVPSLRSTRSSSPKRRWLSPGSRNQPADAAKPILESPKESPNENPMDKRKESKEPPKEHTAEKPTESVQDPIKETPKESPKEGLTIASAPKVSPPPTPQATPQATTQPPSAPQSPTEADASFSAPGEQRLEKDRFDSENNPIETSDEDGDELSSSDDEESPDRASEEAKRGRKETVDHEPAKVAQRTTTKTAPAFQPNNNSTGKSDLIHSAKTGPVSKPDVRPRTSFDSASATNTPFGSEDEAELCDIKRAQKLSIQMSAIDNSVHNRSIRTIIRGDYPSIREEESARRRQRKYLVTTDLSEESVYALEWTIGTILRDGDTLFAVCAMHDETATPAAVQIGDGAKAMQDAAAVVGSQTAETVEKSQNDSSSHLPRAFFNRLGSGTDSKPGSVDARGMSKAESERVRAVEVISQTCVRLLRKTLLQVRVAVEVIHCKSPKHMITEAIDGLDPTLVIVGARGRSALKGVVLGSFSNYLVMHSSVPVMVARKKLKKQTKNKKMNVRLSNNLTTPKKLALAKVD